MPGTLIYLVIRRLVSAGGQAYPVGGAPPQPVGNQPLRQARGAGQAAIEEKKCSLKAHAVTTLNVHEDKLTADACRLAHGAIHLALAVDDRTRRASPWL